MVRAAMKEPGKTVAKTRETVYFRSSQWQDGKPTNQGKTNFARLEICEHTYA